MKDTLICMLLFFSDRCRGALRGCQVKGGHRQERPGLRRRAVVPGAPPSAASTLRRSGPARRRAFARRLKIGALAESFEPVKALHEEIALIVEDSGAPFIQLAKSLEVVNVSQQRIARLATTLEAAAEIQAEFNKLAQAFKGTSPAKMTTAQKAA